MLYPTRADVRVALSELMILWLGTDNESELNTSHRLTFSIT